MKPSLKPIIVIDFGAQYSKLIARRVRESNVFSLILPYTVTAEELKAYDPAGLIFSGGPASVHAENAPMPDTAILDLGVPILGICYGCQLIAHTLGGHVAPSDKREYGIAHLLEQNQDGLLKGLNRKAQVWMSHGDAITQLPEGFECTATTTNCPYAAIENPERKLYGVQFHPEVVHTPQGSVLIGNFVHAVCGCDRSWSMHNFLEKAIDDIRAAVGDAKVILGLSGGVDSSVAAVLIHRAIGDQLTCVFVNNSLLRKGEPQLVQEVFRDNFHINLVYADSEDRFLSALEGITDPEEKRKIIGNYFITVFEEEAYRLKGVKCLVQGTIYPDTIESAGTKHADKIKTHHNRVDIILDLIEKGQVVEPLAQLYKDEVRILGEALGVPHHLVWRHPFPGPGLAVRVLCSDANNDPVPMKGSEILQREASQYGYNSCILPVRSVGVQGDERTYAYPALLWAGVQDWGKLEQLSTRLTNNLSSVNRVVYGLKVQNPHEYLTIKAHIDRRRLDKLRDLDSKITKTLKSSGEYERIWQMPVILLPLVNKTGGECIVLRPITSREAMTARFAPLKKDTIEKILDYAAAVEGIGDIFFDITHKPPATIEWE